MTARRGEVLREHILATAKDVFLELGFAGASMDVVAQRAQTSKRSLYAHFETKEALFLAVIDRIHELFLGRIKSPSDYASEPEEAVVLYCARVAQMFTWAPIVRTCRLGISEAERLPGAAEKLYEAFFGAARDALDEHLVAALGVDPQHSTQVAERCLGVALHPWFARALFAVETPRTDVPEESTLGRDVDLDGVRRAVTAHLRPD